MARYKTGSSRCTATDARSDCVCAAEGPWATARLGVGERYDGRARWPALACALHRRGRDQRLNTSHPDRIFEALCNKPVHEVFDVICGTSTGGIIAADTGIRGAPIKTFIDVYENKAAEIFPKGWFSGKKTQTRAALLGSDQYPAKGLETILQENTRRSNGEGYRRLDVDTDSCGPRVFVVSSKLAPSPRATWWISSLWTKLLTISSLALCPRGDCHTIPNRSVFPGRLLTILFLCLQDKIR